MYCPNCGNEVNESAVICVKCGIPINRQTPNQMTNQNFNYSQTNDISSCYVSGGMKFLCFMIPILGIILFATETSKNPIKAKQYLNPAIAGFVVSLILSIITVLIPAISSVI